MGQRRGHRHKKVTLASRKRGLILCEGETEENYFKGLISQEKYRRKFSAVNVNIYKPKDHSPTGLVNKAKEKIKEAKSEKNKYEFVWVVFDKDGHERMPEAFELARASNPEIKIAFTIPCFEYFVLLHFEKTTKPFKKCDEVISHIKTKGYLPEYEKASNLYEILKDKKDDGLVNSQWLLKQFEDEIKQGKKYYELSSFSNIHELVEYLFNLIN